MIAQESVLVQLIRLVESIRAHRHRGAAAVDGPSFTRRSSS